MTAAQTLHHSGLEGKIIKIFTDSKACIHALSSVRTTSKTVVDCQKALNLIGSRNTVSLVWVPSHMGIKGNECSDFLARKASDCTLVGPEPGVHVSKNTVRLEINSWVYHEHKSFWEEHPAGKQSKLLHKGPEQVLGRQLVYLPRRQLKCLTDILTGHCQLQKHLHTIGLMNDPMCRCCCEDEEETAFHFIGDCEAFVSIRKSVFGKEYLASEDIRILTIPSLLKYVKATERFD